MGMAEFLSPQTFSATTAPTLLQVQDLTCCLGGKRLFDAVSFAICAGESVALLGPNGAGKSSLLRALAGELTPASGNIQLHERRLADWRSRDLARCRAVMPQQVTLSFPLTVTEVVALGLHGRERGHTRHPLVMELLNWLGVAHLAQRRYPTLSGGEQQRVQLARVLVQIWQAPQAPLLLLDECTSALDPRWQHQVLHRLHECRQREFGLLWTVHDLNMAARYADRILLLQEGKLVASGTPAQVLTPQRLAAVYGIDVQIIDVQGIPQVVQLGFVSDR